MAAFRPVLPIFATINFAWSVCNFKSLSYYFEETIKFDVKASLARGSVSRLVKPGDITKKNSRNGSSAPRDF